MENLTEFQKEIIEKIKNLEMPVTTNIPAGSGMFSSYIVTGVDRGGKRFKMVYSDYFTASCINIWNGTLFGILKSNGKRKVIKRVYN